RAHALAAAADLARWAGLEAETRSLAGDALAAAEEAGDPVAEANTLNTLSNLTFVHDPAAGRAFATRSGELGRAAGADFTLSRSFFEIGWAWMFNDRYGTALETMDRAAELHEFTRCGPMHAFHVVGRAWAALHSGELRLADEVAREGLHAAREA